MTRLILLQVARTVLASVVVAVLGTYAFVVLGGSAHVIAGASMQPALRVGDVLMTRPSDGQLSPGQIILIRPGESPDRPVSHRIVEVRGQTLVTMGDAGQGTDPPVPVNWVQGEGVATVPWLGLPTLWLREGNLPALSLITLALVLLTWAATRPLSPPSPVGEDVSPGP